MGICNTCGAACALSSFRDQISSLMCLIAIAHLTPWSEHNKAITMERTTAIKRNKAALLSGRNGQKGGSYSFEFCTDTLSQVKITCNRDESNIIISGDNYTVPRNVSAFGTTDSDLHSTKMYHVFSIQTVLHTQNETQPSSGPGASGSVASFQRCMQADSHVIHQDINKHNGLGVIWATVCGRLIVKANWPILPP